MSTELRGRRQLHSMNKCTRGATLDMSNTNLLVHPIGTVKSDLPQSTLQIQVESVGDVVDGTTVSAVSGNHWWWDEMDEDCVHVVLTMFCSGVLSVTLHMYAFT